MTQEKKSCMTCEYFLICKHQEKLREGCNIIPIEIIGSVYKLIGKHCKLYKKRIEE